MLKVVSETSQSSKLFTVSRIFFLSLGVLPALCLFPREVDLLLAEAEAADEARCRVALLFFFFSLDFLFSFFSFFLFLLLSSADEDEDSPKMMATSRSILILMGISFVSYLLCKPQSRVQRARIFRSGGSSCQQYTYLACDFHYRSNN